MARKTRTEVLDIVGKLLKRDYQRNVKFRAMDRMFYNEAIEPSPLANEAWFRFSPTTMPSDAIWGGMRVLSRLNPTIAFSPQAIGWKARTDADQYERVLLSQLLGASRMGKSKNLRQAIHSALSYDMVAIQLDFLDWQKDNIAKRSWGDLKMLEVASSKGQFVLDVWNAKSVHTVHTKYGLSRVVFDQILPVREVIDQWGDRAESLKTLAKDQEYVLVVDYWDYNQRALVACASQGLPDGSGEFDLETLSGADIHWLIDPEKEDSEHGLPFLPIVVKGGGSTTETSPALHFRPLLDSVYKSGQYDTLNLIQSLIASGVLEGFGRANMVVESEDGQYPAEVRSGTSPAATILVRVGERAIPLPAVAFDVGLLQLKSQLEASISASTISKLLLGDVPSGIAYATYNLGQQSAVRSIVPYQELVEDALGDVCELMLKFAEHAKIDIQSWVYSKEKTGYDEENGLQTIPYSKIDKNHCQVVVALNVDLPVDNVQRTNAGLMLLQLGASRRYSLESAGVADVTKVMDERFDEDLELVIHANEQASLSAEHNQQYMQLAQELLAKEMKQQQKDQQEQQTAEVAPAEPAPGGSGSGEPLTKAKKGRRGSTVKGQGFNPAKGGKSTISADSSDTQEGKGSNPRTAA